MLHCWGADPDGGAGADESAGEGCFGQGFEGREVGLDGGGLGERQKLEGSELFVPGERGEAETCGDEGGEELGFALGEGGLRSGGGHRGEGTSTGW